MPFNGRRVRRGSFIDSYVLNVYWGAMASLLLWRLYQAALCRSPDKRPVNIVHAGFNKRYLNIAGVSCNSEALTARRQAKLLP
jgi:hypothetical protein